MNKKNLLIGAGIIAIVIIIFLMVMSGVDTGGGDFGGHGHAH